MKSIVPLFTIEAKDQDPIAQAIHDITWAQQFAVALLTQPKPKWWVEMGLPDDFEDTAILQGYVQHSAETLSKLRQLKEAGACQHPASSESEVTHRAQLQG